MSQNQMIESRKLLTSDGMKARLEMVLPAHMDPDRMTRIALAQFSKNPKLAECKPETVGMALVQAAEVGLEVNGWDAHLIPYGRECQFQADYKGMCKLAYQSDLIADIGAEVVREGDFFEWEKGTDTYLRWKPSSEDAKDRPMTHVWAMAEIKGGGKPFIVMTREKVMQHKAKSQSASKSWSPWNDPLFEESMWKKTALRMLCKILPRSSALTQLLIHEAAAEAAESSRAESPLAGLLSKPEEPPIDVPVTPTEPESPKTTRKPRKPKDTQETPPQEPESPEYDHFRECKRQITGCNALLEWPSLRDAINSDPRTSTLTQEQQQELAELMMQKQDELEG